MKKNPFPYINLRQREDGTYRPRFVPGPRQRAAGFVAEDLKHDGRWMNLEEVRAWSMARAEQIRAAARGDKVAIAPALADRSVKALLEEWLSSPDVAALRPSTIQNYETNARAICWQKATPRIAEPFAAMPARAVQPANVKAFFEYLERTRSIAVARQAILTLSAAYCWSATSAAWQPMMANPCLRLKLRRPKPRVLAATREEVRALVAAADRLGYLSIGDAIMLAVFSGQRRADVLSLTGRDIAGSVAKGDPVRLKQQKTGTTIAFFAGGALSNRLIEAEARRRTRLGDNVVELAASETPVIVDEKTGKPWTKGRFGRCFREVRDLATVECKSINRPDLGPIRFQDLRDTAISWLGKAGASNSEIAAISGHKLGSISQILAHYMEFDQNMAREANRKLEGWLERDAAS